MHSNDVLALLLMAATPFALALAGGYHTRHRRASRLLFAARLLLVGVAMSWMAIILSAAAGWPIQFGQMLALTVLLPVGWLAARAVCDRHPAIRVDRVLLIGSGDVSDHIATLVQRHPERHMRVIGRVGGDPAPGGGSTQLLGQLDDLPNVLEHHRIDRVIVAFPSEPDALLLDRLRGCVGEGVQVDIVPRLYELVGASPRSVSLGGMALIEAPGRGLTISQQIAKRAFDIAGAGVALLVLGPVMLVAALAIAVLDGRPVLFRQSREGQAGRAFQMLKFRTMTPAPPPSASTFTRAATAGQAIDAHKRRSDARVTPVGRILRKWSIDELPQLWNVLRGDMSLVGPRPLPLYESAHLDGWHQSRRDLKPGLTGLWQVMGRTTIPWDERMQLDYHYVSHWSVASDLRILARTVPVVLKRDGAV